MKLLGVALIALGILGLLCELALGAAGCLRRPLVVAVSLAALLALGLVVLAG